MQFQEEIETVKKLSRRVVIGIPAIGLATAFTLYFCYKNRIALHSRALDIIHTMLFR